MIKKHLAVFGLVFSLLLMFADPVLANVLSGASATADCNGFMLTVDAADLRAGTFYTIDFTFTLTPISGPPTTVTHTITFTAKPYPYIALVFSHLTRCTEGVTVAFSAVVVVVTVVEGNHGGAELGFDV